MATLLLLAATSTARAAYPGTNDRGARGGSSFSNSQPQPGVAGGEGGGVQTR